MRKILLGVAVFVVLVPISIGIWIYASFEPITSCDSIGNAQPLCGWTNPEDMEALPDSRYVIASEYGGLNGERTGTLALLDLETEARQVLYSGGATTRSSQWGDSNCTEVSNTEFSPHGIHLSERADGTLQLLVVQHGGRESIEMFEVVESTDAWELSWRGCVITPEASTINDVVATPDGGFLVTHMMTRTDNVPVMFAEYMKGSLFGIDTGYVLAWHEDEGFSELANSAGITPNGIQISADGESVYVNYSNGEVRRINRQTGEFEASNDTLPALDNSTWSPDGRLLVAAASENFFDMMTVAMMCTNLETGVCPAAHAIIALDAETLESEIIYEGGPGTPGGMGTVGLLMPDGSLLVGTFAGDRIVRITLP